MSKELTLVEFDVNPARIRGYEEAGEDLEVLFASRGEPADGSFSWSHLPGGKGLRPRRWLALAHALRDSASRRWVGVHPGWSDMLFLAWLARRRGKPLEFWLGEEQGKQWLTFLLLRAFGSHVEATHWRTCLASHGEV